MPYHIVHEGSKYKVVVDATGKVVGKHPSKAQAQAQLGALYANVPDAKILKCLNCLEKGKGPCWEGYQYAGTKEQNGKTVPNCIPAKKSIEKLLLTGGDGWSVEFNTPDCQHGWAVMKSGTGQSIGCYLTKEEAEKNMEALMTDKIDLLSDEVRTTKTPEEIKEDSLNKCMTCGCGDLGADHKIVKDNSVDRTDSDDKNSEVKQESDSSFWSGVFIQNVPRGYVNPNFHTQNQDDRFYSPSKASYENDGKPSAGYGNRSSNKTTP